MDAQSLRRKGVDGSYVKQYIYGENVIGLSTAIKLRWHRTPASFSLVPLGKLIWCWSPPPLATGHIVGKHLSPSVVERGKDNGDDWWGWYRWIPEKYRTPLSITFFAFVATHNHFVVDRGGKVFNRSAPIMKLWADVNEDDHLAFSACSTVQRPAFGSSRVFPKGKIVDQMGHVSRTWSDEDL